jgi:hypothetical protein
MAGFLAMVLSRGTTQVQARPPETEAINRAKQTIVMELDRRLPRTTFERWLLDLFGPLAMTHWEVNDCGDQTGNPSVDQGRDFPMCVEASAALGGDRRLHLLQVVATFKTGVRRDTPKAAAPSSSSSCRGARRRPADAERDPATATGSPTVRDGAPVPKST